MLDALLANLAPSHAKTLLEAVEQLSRFSMTPAEDATSFMQRVRSLAERLDGVVLSQLMPLFAIANLDKDRYPGLVQRYIADDPALTNATLLSLQSMMTREERRHAAIHGCPPATPSQSRIEPAIQRVSGTPKDSAAKTPPDCQRMQPEYPPFRGISWGKISAVYKNADSCPACHYNNSDSAEWKKERVLIHRTVGCPAFAKAGFVCKHDPDTAKEVYRLYNDKFPKPQARPPKVVAPPADVPSARCATSSSPPVPPPTAPPPSPPPTQNRFDDLLSSGSESESDALIDNSLVIDSHKLNQTST